MIITDFDIRNTNLAAEDKLCEEIIQGVPNPKYAEELDTQVNDHYQKGLGHAWEATKRGFDIPKSPPP